MDDIRLVLMHMLFIFALIALWAPLPAGNFAAPVLFASAAAVSTVQPSEDSDDSGATAPSKRLSACGKLQRANTHYVLETDVKSSGTCFSISADNITLDLNGHSIIYGTDDSARPSFGVIAADCWDKDIAGSPCGGSHKHAVIENGKIIQGAAAAPMSHAVRFGQALNLTGIVVHDLDITVSVPDSFGIYGEYLPGGSDIYHNTIHNNVKVISNRHQFRGMSIKLDGENKATLPDLVHDNTIIGGAQAGIRVDNSAGSKIFRNDISQDATYTNGFCIDAAGAKTQVYGNKCHPVHGRGIHTNASGVQIFDNVVETVDSGQNEEYNGCEINGTYGIQAESDAGSPENIEIYHNHVIAHAAKCPAAAMRLTDLLGASVDIHDNTFIAVQDKIGSQLSDQSARGFSVGNVTGENVKFTRNFVQADSTIFHMDWDGVGSIKLEDNTFKAGVHGTATLLADFENGTGPSQENIFADNVMQGFSASAVKFGEYTGDSWLDVGSSFTVHLTDQRGRAVVGAEARISDGWERPARGVTDARGNAKLLLPWVRAQNKQPPKKFREHSLVVTHGGCETLQFDLSPPMSKVVNRTLNCQ